MNKTIGLILFLCGGLYGCSNTPQKISEGVVETIPDYEPVDGPPAYPVNVDRIANAVPRIEAKSRYGNPETYTVLGRSYRVMPDNQGYMEIGIASWYGSKFHGRKTSNGETYDMLAMTAAHKALPIPTYLDVTNLENGRKVVVRVNDRGPFHEDRLIDLSYAAAAKLGINASGTARVQLKVIDPQLQPKKIPYSDTHSVYLQLGAFSKYQNAVKLHRQLKHFPNPKIQTEQGPYSALYRVQVGPIASAWQANRVKQLLANLGITHYRSITGQPGS